MKAIFFQGQATAKIPSALQPTYTLHTLHHVWFTNMNNTNEHTNEHELRNGKTTKTKFDSPAIFTIF